jgi:hypothetical protein
VVLLCLLRNAGPGNGRQCGMTPKTTISAVNSRTLNIIAVHPGRRYLTVCLLAGFHRDRHQGPGFGRGIRRRISGGLLHSSPSTFNNFSFLSITSSYQILQADQESRETASPSPYRTLLHHQDPVSSHHFLSPHYLTLHYAFYFLQHGALTKAFFVLRIGMAF